MKTKIKYIPITFETPEELAKALLDGRRFRYYLSEGWHVLYSEECKFYSYRDEVGAVGCEVVEECLPIVQPFRKEEIVEEEVRWEDDLVKYPEGMLCWVWHLDYEIGEREVDLIKKYNPGDVYPYEGGERTWQRASPLTREDVLQFIYEGDESET